MSQLVGGIDSYGRQITQKTREQLLSPLANVSGIRLTL